MAEPYVRQLQSDELAAGARLVSEGMLGSLADETVGVWAASWKPEEAHGAFTGDDQLVGVVRWFADEASVPGGSVPAAGVTAVAVQSPHRRQGHLTRLMDVQLESMRSAGMALALLVAAEWPIYGRYGYGPAIDACDFEIDAKSAEFPAERHGHIELVTPVELRPHLEAVHRVCWERATGSLQRRSAHTWDWMAGVERWPGSSQDLGMLRSALWRDDDGVVRGAVSYKVTEIWTHQRPNGKAEVTLLVGETPDAERELWRHLCEVDWVTTVTAELRGVDDPLPLYLTDGRAAAATGRWDANWARILDVPAAFGARRAMVSGRVVLDVDDRQGYAAGRWAIELGPDAGSATVTDESPDAALSIGALSALYFGGRSPRRLAEAGWITERSPGGVDRLSALLATPTAPWSTTTY